ncbi:hypothetical protein BJY01DRAFT_234041 [Aspergillus pseudoustus]|uniref:Uncharacterized protein n=1 Tax=Aspergillus pseudoustus TaxID=1810923 RepID=A0ABR4K7A1_9EURO
MPSAGWLPPSLRPPYLLSVAAFLLLLTLAIEALRQHSHRHGGIVKYGQEKEISSMAYGAWTNTPTFLALVAGILWQVCAQDVLRLEPYFQLARSHGRRGGAPATVLFTNYRFDAGILAPIRAARNRHYLASCISFMSLVLGLALPSLLSGLLILDVTTVSEKINVTTWPNLVDVQTQEDWLLNAASYHDPWRRPDSDDPEPNISSRYAVAPISIAMEVMDTVDERSSYLVTWQQSVYWSNMSCSSASLAGFLPSVIPVNSSSTDSGQETRLFFNVSNVKISTKEASECSIGIDLETSVVASDGRFQARHWEPVQHSLDSPSSSVFNVSSCPSTGFTGVVIDIENLAGESANSNVNVFICEPVYRQATASVSYQWNLTVADVDVDSATVESLTGEEFSTNALPVLISAELSGAVNSTVQAGRPRVSLVSGSNMVNILQYRDSLSRLWERKFLITINKFFNLADPVPANTEQELMAIAITVSARPAMIAQIILLLGFLLLLCLGYRYHRGPNFLVEDPGPLDAQCKLISRLISPRTLQALSHPDFHCAKTRELRRWARGLRCGWTEAHQIELQSPDCVPLKICPLPKISGRSDPMPHFLVRPWFVVEFILLVCAVITFGLACTTIEFKGLYYEGTMKVLIAYVFLSFGPPVLASFICALFTSVHRNIAVVDAWVRLRREVLSREQLAAPVHNTFITTLVAAVKSPTPVLPVMKALSLVCLLNLVLVVVGGGLFEPQLKTLVTDGPDQTMAFNPSIFLSDGLQSNYTDYHSIVYATATNASSRQPWTSGELSYLPLEADDWWDPGYTFYTSVTRGIGSRVRCDEVSHNSSVSDSLSRSFNWTYTVSSGKDDMQCTVLLPLQTLDTSGNVLSINYTWASDPNPLCQRASFFVSASWGTTTKNLHCRPEAFMDNFLITFSQRGIIRHSIPAPAVNISFPLPAGDSPLFRNASSVLGGFNQGLGHFLRQPHLIPYESSFPDTLTLETYQQTLNNSSHRPEKNSTTSKSHSHSHSQSPSPSQSNRNTTALTHAIESTYQQLFATYLSIHRDRFLTRFQAHSPKTVPGKTMDILWGFMPSRLGMGLVSAILCIDALTLGAVFLRYYGQYDAPRMPKSMGALIPWVARKRQYQLWSESRDLEDGKERTVWVLDYADLRPAQSGLKGDGNAERKEADSVTREIGNS